jgi:hypothetical protein
VASYHSADVDKIRLELRGAAEKVSDSKLDDLEAKFESDVYYHMKIAAGDRKEIIPVLLAGIRRRPEQPYWTGALMMFPASDKLAAKELDADKKKEYYLYTLAYLQEASVDLAQAESTNEPDEEDSSGFVMLQSPMAVAAMGAGELRLSKQLANEMLLNNDDPNSWNYGNVIHKANTILGHVALREGHLDKARSYLIRSGNTPGSPQLNSFGPSFELARELLEKGETDAVMEYLDLVAVFWANPDQATRASSKRNAQDHAAELLEWKQEIKEGKIPQGRKWR